MLSHRSKNVVQVAANRTKLRIVDEQKEETCLAAPCHNLLLLSGLRRLRQDLANLISRFANRGSPVRSRSRPPTICLQFQSLTTRPRPLLSLPWLDRSNNVVTYPHPNKLVRWLVRCPHEPGQPSRVDNGVSFLGCCAALPAAPRHLERPN
jgi:hypothetical protein